MVPEDQLPDGVDLGISFTSVCINIAIYLPWLVSECLKLGVVLRRGVADHIKDAADMHHSAKRADIVINCTGLGSLNLGGVQDSTLYPQRGQIALVRNVPSESELTMYSISGTDDGPEEATYIMHRPAAGGCVLGGCRQNGRWDSQPDLNLAARMMKRCIELDPSIVPQDRGVEALSIVRHGVGLRPMRDNGPRIELESVSMDLEANVSVVHLYGHGGCGYQMSYATAQAAVDLVYRASAKITSRL